MLIILDTVNIMVHTILNNENKGGLEMKCDRCGTEIYSDAYEYEDETVCQHCRENDNAYEESLRDQYMDFMRYGRVE